MSDAFKSFAPTHNSKALHQGLIVLGLILFGAYLLYDRGLLSVLLAGDKSRLSWLILLILSLIHISEPTRLRRISYAVFCLKKKKQKKK